MANHTSAEKSPPRERQGIQTEVWEQYKSSLDALLQEMLEQNSGQAQVPDGEALHGMVTDAVTAVLVESDLLEKFVAKTVHNYFNDAGEKLQEKLIPR